MIDRLEDVVGRLWVCKTLPQVGDLILKVLWLKELVRQSRKVHVEEICDLAVLKTFGLTGEMLDVDSCSWEQTLAKCSPWSGCPKSDSGPV